MKRQQGNRGQVLIIVLGYVALITVLILTLVLVVSNETNVAHNYYSESTVKTFEKGAAIQVVSDLQQQIVTNSSLSSGIYTPTNRGNMVPSVSGFITGPGLENLVMVSNPRVRASSISSNTATPEGSQESNSIWNKMLYLTPNSSTDPTPCAANFTAPDWIYCAQDGTNPTTWSSNYSVGGSNPVMQRYSYAIYDEGGMLDLNVAGSPVNKNAVQTGGVACLKNSLAYVDLTQIPGISSTALTINGVSTPVLSSSQQQSSVINAIVGWRNHNSSQATGSIAGGFTFPTVSSGLTPFDQSIRSNSNGFLTTANYNSTISSTDSAFTSRQQMISFLQDCFSQLNLPSSNVSYLLQYLSHYSRELNQPSYAPNSGRPTVMSVANGGNDLAGNTSQNSVNPAFLSLTATSAFIRNDGSVATVGEPLVKSRFPLQRLSWLTYQGPSSGRNSSSSSSSNDYDIYLLETNYGIPAAYLSEGNAAAIYKNFGLSWISDTRVDGNGSPLGNGTMKWVYNHNLANPAPGVTTSPITSLTSATGTPIKTLTQVQALGRDPDFVELLKAAVCAGSLAKPGTTAAAISTPSGYQNAKDSSLDAAIIQLAANIIDQYDTDSVPTCILFNDGTWSDGISPAGEEYRGVEDIPYIYEVYGGMMALQDSAPSTVSGQASYHDSSSWVPAGTSAAPTLTNPGIGAAFQLPVIWDPHAYSSTSAQGPRPINFRLVAQDAPPYQNGPASPDPNQFIMQAYGRYLTPGPETAPSATSPQHSVSLNPTNTELDFRIPTTRLDLFREPTILQKAGVPVGSGLATASQNLINTDTTLTLGLVPPLSSGGTVVAQSPLAGGQMYTNVGLTDNLKYLGIYLGDFPLRWPVTTTTAGVPTTTIYTASIATINGGNQYVTYRLQAQNPATNQWLTYDEKFTKIAFVNQTNNSATPGFVTISSMSGPNGGAQVISVVDPRTSRLGMIPNLNSYNAPAYTDTPPINRNFSGQGGYTNSLQAGWAGIPGQYNQTTYQNAASANAIWTNRPDICSGFAFSTPSAAGFIIPASSNGNFFRPGLLTQNNANPNAMDSNNRFSGSSTVGNQTSYNGSELGSTSSPQYFADADGVVRRGMSAYLTPVPSTPLTASAAPCIQGAPSGNPLNVANTYSGGVATPIASEIASRPIMMNRPFETVAEMGGVFSGTPWRNIDFFTPESGSAALLDVFCVADQSTNLIAGAVDLNTRQESVLQAVLSGSYEDQFDQTTAISPTTGVASANALATAIVKRTSDLTGALGAGSGPLENLSDLVGAWNTSVKAPDGTYVDGSQSYLGFSGTQAPQAGSIPSTPPNLSYILSSDTSNSGYTLADIQRFRESAIRSLSAVGQVRVWNLCIDMISQTGRFSSQATSLSQFHVESESRCLVHLAIDRYTGKVLDEQFEKINQ